MELMIVIARRFILISALLFFSMKLCGTSSQWHWNNIVQSTVYSIYQLNAMAFYMLHFLRIKASVNILYVNVKLKMPPTKRKLDLKDSHQQSVLSYLPSKRLKTNDEDKENNTVKSFFEQVTPSTAEDCKFKRNWIEQFPFIKFDEARGVMICKDCEAAKRDNIWTSGCDKMKVDAIRKHMKTKDHQFAITAKSFVGDLDRAAIKAAEKEREGVIGIMKNIYYLAKRNEPSSAISDLNKLLLHHKVSDFVAMEKSNKSLPYEHHESIKEMQDAMAKVVKEELLQDIRDSGIFSIMADVSTDISTEKTLVLYVRYAKCGQSETKFLELTELAGDECKALNICDAILKVLENRKLNIDNMCCITTDGASVMTGVRGGVTTLMKQKNSRILSIHCIAHRLALASGQATDSIRYLKKYQATINAIYKYYHYSPKHQGRLNKIQSVFNMASRKFRQTFHTRWLSFEGAVDAVIENYDALITCLELDVAEEGDPTATGLLKFVSDYQFLAVSHLLGDILNILAILSKNFQIKDLDLCTQNFAFKAAVGALTLMKSSPGPLLSMFLDSLPNNYESGFDFGKHGSVSRIKCSQAQISETEKIRQMYLDNILKNLKERFTDSGITSSFSVLNPMDIPENDAETLITYGDKEIHTLSEFYGGDGQSPLSVNKRDLKAEWTLFKFHLSKKYKGMKFNQMSKSVLEDESCCTSYPNILKLIKICAVLPVSSADCERGFSRYNLIKTKTRNELEPESVNRLLTLTVDTPELNVMQEFSFDRAFDNWASTKNRKLPLMGKGILKK